MNEKDFVDEKMLSVIIPHYNSAELLNQLIESIPKSDDIEILVIDDRSDDDEPYNRLKEREEYSNIIFLRNDEGPKGPGTCRNIGLSAATGKWILFADSDDYFVRDFYGVVSEYFASDYDVIFFTPTSEDLLTGEKSNRHEIYERIIEDVVTLNDEQSDLSIRYRFVVPWSKMIRRKLIIDNNIKFEEKIVSEDTMFSIKVGHLMNRYTVSKKIIYCVTKGKGTLSKIANEKTFFLKLDTFINRDIFFKEHLGVDKYDTLSISGAGMIANCFMVYKLGIRSTIKTYFILKQNKVKILSKTWRNPFKLYDKIKTKIKYEKGEENYYVQQMTSDEERF